MSRFPSLFLAATAVALVVGSAVPSLVAASALFVLGDSSVSCGDNTFFPRFPGNFSTLLCDATGRPHRRLLPDFIAERMGLPPLPPFYGENGTVQGLINGINFGSSPATILSVGYASFFMFQDLSEQIRQVYDTLLMLQLALPPEEAKGIVSSALFYLSFGRDDYADLFTLDSFGLIPKYGRRGFSQILVPQMIRAVQDLYNAGARRMVVAGMGPLGCAPWVMWEALGDEGALDGLGCVGEVNELSSDYNAGLSAGLADLIPRLPGVHIVFCDVYAGIIEIIANPATYGFADVKNACCGGLGWFGAMVACLAPEMACGEPSRRVWWDPYSPTAAVNELLAQWAWSGGPHQICGPPTVGELASNPP